MCHVFLILVNFSIDINDLDWFGLSIYICDTKVAAKTSGVHLKKNGESLGNEERSISSRRDY